MCPVYSANDVTGLYPGFSLSPWERVGVRDEVRRGSTIIIFLLPGLCTSNIDGVLSGDITERLTEGRD
jgi:hypothetical protein